MQSDNLRVCVPIASNVINKLGIVLVVDHYSNCLVLALAAVTALVIALVLAFALAFVAGHLVLALLALAAIIDRADLHRDRPLEEPGVA